MQVVCMKRVSTVFVLLRLQGTRATVIRVNTAETAQTTTVITRAPVLPIGLDVTANDVSDNITISQTLLFDGLCDFIGVKSVENVGL